MAGMQFVEVSTDFIKNLKSQSDFHLSGAPNPVEAFHPPRPWHPEKYNRFLKGLVAQNPRL